MKITLRNELNHVIDFTKLDNNSIIVDLGSAVGGFVSEIRKYSQTRDAKIICVECSRKNIEKFKKNKFKNVILIEKAVGKTTDGFVTFTEFVGQKKPDGNNKYYQWGNTQNNHEDKLSRDSTVQINKYDVPLITIEQIIKEMSLEKIDYLKIDIEGAEYEVFDAMKIDTAKKISQISMETHNQKKDQNLIDRLEGLGFIVEKYAHNEIYAFRG